MKDIQEPKTWRELLGRIIDDPAERQRIANVLGVSTVTIMRWVHNESKPRPRHMHHLLNALPTHRPALLELITKEFPDFFAVVTEERKDDHTHEIPSEFYSRVLDTYASTPKAQRFWTISTLILQQALGHLDPNHLGMALTIVQCLPPLPGQKIYSLREHVGRGTPPWPAHLEQHAILLGAESLAGYAVASGRSAVVQSRTEASTFPVHWAKWEESSAAYPLMHAAATAGCLLASSTQQHYFLPFRQMLLQRYTNLILLAFELEEFYPLDDISLQPKPSYCIQQERLANFQQRIARVQIEALQNRQQMTFREAELVVWRQIEEELSSLLYAGSERNL